MQRDLVILSSSPGQPLLEDETRAESYKASSTSISYLGVIDKRLKSGSNASQIPENAVTNFQLASSLLPMEDHERALEHVLAIGSDVQEPINATNSVAGAGEKKKRTLRRKDDPTVNTGRKKKREADKTTTPGSGRVPKNLRKGKATGRVSAYFGSGKEQENGDGKPGDVPIDLTGSPPPRRRISWTPPKSYHPSIAPDEAVIQISEFGYKDAQVEASSFKQSTFTIGKKIEV
jgi:hypothetical protein